MLSLKKLEDAAKAARDHHRETKLRYSVYRATDADLWAAWNAAAEANDALSQAKQKAA